MESLARFSVSRPATVLMLVLGILLLGGISFRRLGVELLPELANPRLFVEVEAGDLPPSEVEARITAPIEAAASLSRGVVDVASVSSTGGAQVTVEYGWGADMDEAFLDLQKGLAEFARRQEVEEVSVSRHDPNGRPVVVAAFRHPEVDDLDALRRTAESIVRSELVRLPGVAAVEVVGARRLEVEVLTDAYTLEAYGLTLEQLAAAVRNANRNMSGGSIVEMGRRYLIRGVGEFSSAADLEGLVVTQISGEAAAPEAGQGPGGPAEGAGAPATSGASEPRAKPVFLRDVAEVRQVLSEPRSIVRLDGRRCLGLEIYREARHNTIDAARAVHGQLEILRRSLPGYEIEVIQDQSRFIAAAVSEVEETGLVGVLLAVAVLFVFLRRLGVTAVISLAIPISVVATFNLMYFGELSLNLMTLGGLALGAGMLVDNAIVVVENVFRHMERGESPARAAVLGAGEVGGAITSATLTTIVVFLPIVYLQGAAGELFREQAWTVAFSLLSSLFVALVVIPMLCSRLLGRGGAPPAGRAPFPRYGALLGALLRRRVPVVLVAAALVAGTGAVLSRLGSEFMPHLDPGQLSLHLTLPEGTRLDRTEGAVRNVETTIAASLGPELAHLYSRVGRAAGSAGPGEPLAGENHAVIHVQLGEGSPVTAAALAEALGEAPAGPDAQVRYLLRETALETSLGRPEAPVVVEIHGQSLGVLAGLAEEVEERLAGIEGLHGVESSLAPGRPEIEIVVDRAAAAAFHLGIDAIGSQLQSLLSGQEAGRLRQRGEAADIVIRRPRVTPEELGGLLLEAPGGLRVRLDEVSRLRASRTPREILRRNQQRVVTVSARLGEGEPFDRVAGRVTEALGQVSAPPEYGFDLTGEEKLRQDSFRNLRFALILAVVLVYMVMAAQFESLLHPFVILLTIPLAGVGAVALLLALGMPLNVMSFIGVILLAGIAVNDSIVLVDRINRNRRSGQELEEAIVNAGRTRIRPILMTSLTTMLALLPLAAGAGEGAVLRAPMAVAVIGGLFSCTALTLAVVPCVYHLFARIDRLRPAQALSR